VVHYLRSSLAVAECGSWWKYIKHVSLGNEIHAALEGGGGAKEIVVGDRIRDLDMRSKRIEKRGDFRCTENERRGGFLVRGL